MTITLAQAALNAQDDVDFHVIDNLRRSSVLLDMMVFDDTASPSGGATFKYGYNRLVTPRRAHFRGYNEEYQPEDAVIEDITVNLKPHGGSFNLDRKLAKLGQARTNQQAIQLQQLIVAVQQKWLEELVNGDVAVDAKGFDGLDVILTGTDTEYDPLENGTALGYLNWSKGGITSDALAQAALDELDLFLSLITPSRTGSGDAPAPGSLPPGLKVIATNRVGKVRIQSLARWASMYTSEKDDLGRTIDRYGDWLILDIGDGQLGTSPIIPIYSADADGGGGGSTITGLTDLFAMTLGMDALHGASPAGMPLMETYLPDWDDPGVVKTTEVEFGPSAPALKNTKACGVLRKVKVQ